MDGCCLNRLTDDQSQERAHEEAVAVEGILRLVQDGRAAWVSSHVDALHLACAEQGAVDVFLTTDDRLLRRARRHAQMLRIRVENPVSWYKEFQT